MWEAKSAKLIQFDAGCQQSGCFGSDANERKCQEAKEAEKIFVRLLILTRPDPVLVA
jgi:hypothetical protein